MDIIYRSSHPDVLAALAKYRTDMADWHDRASALLAEFGFPGRHFMVASGLGSRWISGVELRSGEEAPTGWRIAKSGATRLLKPHKSTKEGKAADKKIAACQPPPDVRADLPGMPSVVWVDRFVRTPSLEEHGGEVWVIWGAEPKSVDAEIWERVRLSEYWAMREAEDEPAS